LYQGLVFLKNYVGNPEDLSLNFTIAAEGMSSLFSSVWKEFDGARFIEFGVAQSIELKPNGSNIPVTRENRLEYIFLVSHYRLTKQIKRQSEAFFVGLSDIIDPKWLR
jgi:ubiquitin-protein ligase E3 C